MSGDIDQNDSKDANGIVAEIGGLTGNNAYHVVTGIGVSSTAVLDGFVINAGMANGTASYHNQGGGVYLSQGSPTLNNLVISTNTSSAQGGGLFNDRSAAMLTNVAFRGNQVPGSWTTGGGMSNFNGSPLLTNVLFSGNTAYTGGGLYSEGGALQLVNGTLSGNFGGASGGAIHIASGSLALVNSIVWGNNSQIAGLAATVSFSIVQGGYTGEGNLDVDPLFAAAQHFSVAPSSGGDYRPRYGSVTTDMGSNTPLTAASDLDGNPRLVDGDGDGSQVVDLGVYEQQAGNCGVDGRLYVNHAAQGSNSGLTWTDAFTDLQTALMTARSCQVWVAKGTYYPAADATDRSQAFLLRSGVQVYGGFAGRDAAIPA